MMWIAYLFGYLYIFWCVYVLVMGLYRAHLMKRLSGVNKALAMPVVIIGYLIDISANWFIAPVIFVDLPREALVTSRLKRYKLNGSGWRYVVASFICDQLLDVFDPTGDHC